LTPATTSARNSSDQIPPAGADARLPVGEEPYLIEHDLFGKPLHTFPDHALRNDAMTAMLEMRGVSKSFAGVQALRDVNFAVEAGQIHALVGENGAGKSTLMKVLSGVYPHGSYEGTITFDGEERRFRDINDSEALGIIIIHQELALIPLMSIAENIFLSHPPARFGVIDRDAVYRRTGELLAQVGLRELPDTLVTDLGIGKQQLVEIAKALSKRVRLLILDEPTASLNETDSAALLDRLIAFRDHGIASILISHKLSEVARVADRITVLRDGLTVDSIDCRTEPVEEQRIIRSMVNRDLAHRFPERDARVGDLVLEVKNWSAHHPLHPERLIKNVDFRLRRGEVLGIAGLMGAGRTEFAMSLFGHAWGTKITGRIALDGREAELSSVPAAIDAGLAYVTEDRKQFGLILADDVRKNITLASLDQVAPKWVIDDISELKAATDYRSRMRIRCSDVYQETATLSGGNQQKVVLSKWLMTDPKVLILDEPTRGIDVGAKYEIYRIINELAAAGKGIVVISSEMPELLGICDRIYVMNDGAFVGEFEKADASQEKIMHAIMRNKRPGNGISANDAQAGGMRP
jgi:putative multiple sugar transport system ATP-binding protein